MTKTKPMPPADIPPDTQQADEYAGHGGQYIIDPSTGQRVKAPPEQEPEPSA